MKLSLYLPNFRNKVSVKELEDLTTLAEDLEFDSVWTLDRIIVPEASDRDELQYSFGMMDGFPKSLPVSSRGEFLQGMPLIPWLAAKTQKLRIGMSIIDTPFRSPGVLAAELATIDNLSHGRLNVAVGSGWMPEEFAAASATHLFKRRHGPCPGNHRDHEGHLDQRRFRVPRRVRRFRAQRFRRKASPEATPSSVLQRPQGREAFGASRCQIRNVGLDRYPGFTRGAQQMARCDPGRTRATGYLAHGGRPRYLQHDLVRHH